MTWWSIHLSAARLVASDLSTIITTSTILMFVNDITNIISIQCYTIRKLNSRNQGYLPTFSVQSTNLSTIADPIQRRQSESVRSIAGPHKHLHRFELGCIDIIVYCQHPSFTLYEVLVNGTVQALNASNNYDFLYLSVIAHVRLLFLLYKQ